MKLRRRPRSSNPPDETRRTYVHPTHLTIKHCHECAKDLCTNCTYCHQCGQRDFAGSILYCTKTFGVKK